MILTAGKNHVDLIKEYCCYKLVIMSYKAKFCFGALFVVKFLKKSSNTSNCFIDY